MTSLEEIIHESKDVREVKRALRIKRIQQGIPVAKSSAVLHVALQYISKWKGTCISKGMESVFLAYQGSKGYSNSRRSINPSNHAGIPSGFS